MNFLRTVMASMLLLIPATGGAATVLGPYSETTDNNMFIGYAPGVGRIEPDSISANELLTFDFVATVDNLWFTGAGTIAGVSLFDNLAVSTTSSGGILLTPGSGDSATFVLAPTSVPNGNTETLTFSWDGVATLAPATIFFEVVAGGSSVVPPAPPIPLPAAVWLFGSGLLGLVGMARRKKSV